MSEALLAGFQASLLWICVVLLMSLCGIVIAVNVRRQMRNMRRKLKGSAAVAVAVAAAVCILYGGRKGRVTVSDPYIQDAGSYLTNDIVHVSIAKRTQMLPDDTEILVYARQVDLTNATDWVRLEPHLTLASTTTTTRSSTLPTTTCSWPRTSPRRPLSTPMASGR